MKRIAYAMLIVLLLLFAVLLFACRPVTADDARATYGAEQFHAQLTAQAEER